MKSIIGSGLKFLFAFFLIIWMMHNKMLDLSSLAILANPTYLMVSITLVFLTIFINNIRWTLLLRTKGCPLASNQTLPLSLMGIFFNFALPGGVGGDVVKGFYVWKVGFGGKTTAATTLLMDRLMGLYGMVVVSSGVILIKSPPAHPELKLIFMAVIGLFLTMSLFFAMAFSKSLKNNRFVILLFNRIPFGPILNNIYDSIHGFRKHPMVLTKTLLLSFLSQFLIIFFVLFFAGITHAPQVPLSVYLLIVPLGLITTVLPVTPAGIGVGQAALYYFYKLSTGMDNQIGPNALTAFQIILLGWGLIGAYFYVTKKSQSPFSRGTP